MPLYLIATHHGDRIRGPQNLIRLYRAIEPDMLLTEINEEDLSRYQGFCDRLRRDLKGITGDRKGVDAFVDYFEDALGFEYTTNRDYARREKIPNHLIDMPGGQRRLQRMLERVSSFMLTTARMTGALDMRKMLRYFKDREKDLTEEKVEEGWRKIDRHEGTLFGEAQLLLIGRLILGRVGKPDRYMEERIRELYDPTTVIAYPVGALHAMESLTGNTLYSRIKDLNPVRVPLIEEEVERIEEAT